MLLIFKDYYRSSEIWGEHRTYAQTYKLLEVHSTRDCEWEKKMKQSSLEGSAFAKIFLRAKYADAAVLQTLFRTPGITFIIDLGLMNRGTKTHLFLY